MKAYDPATDTWTARPSLSVPRYSSAVAVMGRTIDAIGDSDGKTNFGSVEALDLDLSLAFKKEVQ